MSDAFYRYRLQVGDLVLRKTDTSRHRYRIQEIRGDFAHIGFLCPLDELEPLETQKGRMEQWDGQDWVPVPVYS